MKRISLLCLFLILTACGAETDSSLGMLNQPPSLTIKEGERYYYQVNLINDSENTVVSVEDLPNWAEFDPEEKIISGKPEHGDAGQDYIFNILAIDGDSTFRSQDVTISVAHSNLKIYSPIQTRSRITEGDEYKAVISSESDLGESHFSLLNGPDWLEINEESGVVFGTPLHVHAGQTFSNIQIQLTDGVHTKLSDTFDISVEYIPIYFLSEFSEQQAIEDDEYSFPVLLNYLPEGITFKAHNLPVWASIDPVTGVISGNANNSDFGVVTTGIFVEVIDGNRTLVSRPFSISVITVNDPPQLINNELLLEGFSDHYSVELSYSDEESPSENIGVEVSDTSDAYDVTLNLDGTVSIEVVDGYEVAVNGIMFQVQLSDGENITTAEVTASIEELDYLNVTTDISGDISTNQKLELYFDQPVDLNQISSSQGGTGCVTDVQVSSDNFFTCIDIEMLKLESNWNKATYSLANLENNENYSVRISSNLKSAFGNSVVASTIANFYTVSGLLITEIGSRNKFYDMHWFEVYNASREVINLGDFKVSSLAINSVGCDKQTFSGCNIVEAEFHLNEILIQPGQYKIIRGNDWEQPYQDTDRTTYIGLDIYPYWGDIGYIELINKTEIQTEDFVYFGDWSAIQHHPLPVTSTSWDGDGFLETPFFYNGDTAYAGSIGRSGGNADSNNKADWFVYTIHTAGGPNDVQDVDVDLDQDGIPDYAELEGATFSGMSLYDLGARVGRKDIFIELDYMASSDEGITPRREALEKVVSAFAAKDIAVHFDVGDLFDQAEGVNPENFDLGGGNEVPFLNGIDFSPNADDSRGDFYEIKRSNMSLSRLTVFHYMLMANSLNASGAQGPGGRAELAGNDAIISLGNWGLNSLDEESKNILINTQSSVIMHELGHNLNLRHGGVDDVNYKPNYVSVMNYLYSQLGLPIIGSNEGDRYYFDRNERYGTYNCNRYPMTNPLWGDYRNFIIDYSSEFTSLDEAKIYERDGLGFPGSNNVDFDCDSNNSETLSWFDINYSRSIEKLEQGSDWDRINLKFQQYIQGDFSARLKVPEPSDLSLVPDNIGNDISQVIDEEMPHEAIMQIIHSN